MQRRTTYESHESSPFLPESRVRLSIPVSAGPISLADTVLQGTLDLSAGLKDAGGNAIAAVMNMPDGVAALIREVRVQDSAGRILEHIRRCDVLAALRTSYVADPLGQEQRRQTQLVGEPLAVTFTDNTPVFPQLQFSLPLRELSLGMAELEYWGRGIQIDLVLSNKIDAFARLQTNQPYVCANKTATGPFGFVDLANGWPYSGKRDCSDGGTAMDLQAGDTVSVLFNDGATKTLATAAIASIDLSNHASAKITFDANIASTGIATAINLIPRCQGVTVPAAKIVAAAATPTAISAIPVPIAAVDANLFYVGQSVDVFGKNNKAAAAVVSIATTIASITETGAPAGMIFLMLTAPVAVTNGGAGPPIVPGELDDAIIFESKNVISVEWSISRLELQTAPAVGPMPQGPVKITSVESLTANLPTGVTSGEEEVRPSAANLSEALALISVPLNQAASVAAVGRASHLLGYNDRFADYQIMLDATSAPLQPINVQRVVAPQHLRIVAATVEQTGMGACKNFDVSSLVFARPFSRAEQVMDISGRRLAVRYARTQSTATVIALQSFLWFNKLI